MNAPALRRGWCPGVLRPMRTGDGLIVRLKLSAGIMAPETALALADCAERFGNGLIDLTSRANLQLRGVRDETLEPLQDRLAALGLIDDSAEAEAVRNVMVSPLAGLDAAAAPATLDLARRLEARLTGDPALYRLPPKFLFLVDGGGTLPMSDIAADVALRVGDGTVDIEAGGRLVASPPIEAAVEAALAFVERRLAPHPISLPTRGREGFDAIDPSRPSRSRSTPLDPPPPGGEEYEVGGRPPRRPLQTLTPRRLAGHDPRTKTFAAAIPFGRLDAGQLRLLAGLGSELRLTPWRAVLIAPADAAIAPRLAAAGLVVDPADPILAVAACSGRPACLSGEAEVRTDAPRFAAALAPLIASGATLHVSGCRKGCAHPGPADLTLVAEAGGYRLARRAEASAPAETPLLTPDEMLRHLETLSHA